MSYHLSRSPNCVRLIRLDATSMSGNRVAAIAFCYDGRWQVHERHLYQCMVDTETEAIIAMVHAARGAEYETLG